MILGKKSWAAMLTAGLLALGGCTDGYGYSGLSAGYGTGGYYGGGYGYGAPYGYGYAPSYFGWYNDFYYPGTGIYVYDRYRHPYRWNDGQRAYWEGRRNAWRGGPIRDQWRGWGRGGWRGGPHAGAPRPIPPRAEAWRGPRGGGVGVHGPRPGGGPRGRGPR